MLPRNRVQNTFQSLLNTIIECFAKNVVSIYVPLPCHLDVAGKRNYIKRLQITLKGLFSFHSVQIVCIQYVWIIEENIFRAKTLNKHHISKRNVSLFIARGDVWGYQIIDLLKIKLAVMERGPYQDRTPATRSFYKNKPCKNIWFFIDRI